MSILLSILLSISVHMGNKGRWQFCFKSFYRQCFPLLPAPGGTIPTTHLDLPSRWQLLPVYKMKCRSPKKLQKSQKITKEPRRNYKRAKKWFFQPVYERNLDWDPTKRISLETEFHLKTLLENLLEENKVWFCPSSPAGEARGHLPSSLSSERQNAMGPCQNFNVQSHSLGKTVDWSLTHSEEPKKSMARAVGSDGQCTCIDLLLPNKLPQL